MRYIKISNIGELDIRLVALMGGTTKANDQYKIGHFGTGLKYTLAWLFRNNVDFRIYVGDKQVEVGIEKEIIRNETFEIVCINGQRTSITTGMGMDWKAWMIIREIWCNALDEKSSYYVLYTLTMPGKGSWDGKWTGDDKLHCQIRIQDKNQVGQMLNGQESMSWQYSWEDGWRMNIEAKVVHSPEERDQLLSANAGFCGYDWAIDSIIKHGEILSKQDIEDRKATGDHTIEI